MNKIKDGINCHKTKNIHEGYVNCDPELRNLIIIEVFTQKKLVRFSQKQT